LSAHRFALATSERARRLDPDLPLAVSAFERRGCVVDTLCWDDPVVAWSDYDLVIVGSCWDYTWRTEEFLAWAEQVPRLQNPADVLRWNADKRYLADLDALDCPVVPTSWNPEVEALPDAREWVVKPSVSAGSRDTARWEHPADALRCQGPAPSLGNQAARPAVGYQELGEVVSTGSGDYP